MRSLAYFSHFRYYRFISLHFYELFSRTGVGMSLEGTILDSFLLPYRLSTDRLFHFLLLSYFSKQHSIFLVLMQTFLPFDDAFLISPQEGGCHFGTLLCAVGRSLESVTKRECEYDALSRSLSHSHSSANLWVLCKLLPVRMSLDRLSFLSILEN